MKPGQGFDLTMNINEFGVKIEHAVVLGTYPILFDQNVRIGFEEETSASQTKRIYTTTLDFMSGVKF